MLTNIEAIIFDLDGTLVDSMWLWKAIDVDYLGRFSIDLPNDLQDAIEGMSFTETANYFKTRFDLIDPIDKIKNDWNQMAFDYYTNKVPLKRGVRTFIEKAHKAGISMGVGTSNSKELANAVIYRHQLESYFRSIRTSCEVLKGKPAPDIFLKVAEELGVHPSKCLVFEDIPNGILSAKNAGMRVCAVYDEFSEAMTNDKRNLADYYIDSFEELIEENEVIKHEA